MKAMKIPEESMDFKAEMNFASGESSRKQRFTYTASLFFTTCQPRHFTFAQGNNKEPAI